MLCYSVVYAAAAAAGRYPPRRRHVCRECECELSLDSTLYVCILGGVLSSVECSKQNYICIYSSRS